MIVKSPLTGKSNAVFEKNILCRNIIENYSKTFNIDVEKFFKNLESIQVYRCSETGYRFYYPFNIDGDGNFYEHLQKFDWYYMHWKWEHEQVYNLIKPNNKVLEIGCANGSFVEKLSKSGIECIGLELNEDAVEEGKRKGIKILNESVQEHAKVNHEKYDMICSFQVMEHIALIKDVIQSSIDSLKIGGKLVISVPNNDSFLGYDTENYLNMPPHHMGLWNEQSLKCLPNIFNIKLKKIYLEPLQSYHKAYFSNVMIRYYSKKFKKFDSLSNRIVSKLIPNLTFFFPNRIKAFTIQAVYEKIK